MVGGTCVNRGCVPSKTLLAVSGRMRELQSGWLCSSLIAKFLKLVAEYKKLKNLVF